IAPGVLGNDTDVDGNGLTAVLVTGPTHGTLTLNSDGGFIYIAETNYSGSDSFTYKANDGTADSGNAKVTITVIPAPTTASGPSDATACLGLDVNFATVASGVAPFDFQWRLDGNVAGTNGPSLTVHTAGLSLGNHAVEVVVSGQCGLAVTNTATLSVHDAFA